MGKVAAASRQEALQGKKEHPASGATCGSGGIPNAKIHLSAQQLSSFPGILLGKWFGDGVGNRENTDSLIHLCEAWVLEPSRW